jgi:hypothetical protein
MWLVLWPSDVSHNKVRSRGRVCEISLFLNYNSPYSSADRALGYLFDRVETKERGITLGRRDGALQRESVKGV